MQHLTVQEVQGGVASLEQAKPAGKATIAAVHPQVDKAVKHSPFNVQVTTVSVMTTCLIAGGLSYLNAVLHGVHSRKPHAWWQCTIL